MSPLAERIVGDARLYDRVQQLVGQDQLLARIGAVLSDAEPGVLLDVGAGTAGVYPVVPATLEYVALDPDERKLERVRAKYPQLRTIRASGTTIPLEDGGVDHTLCVDVTHHLRADELEPFFAELARVTRRTLVFVDALRVPRLLSRLLWLIDRGSHPRPLGPLRAAIESSFEVERLETFTIRHTYVLAVARPR